MIAHAGIHKQQDARWMRRDIDRLKSLAEGRVEELPLKSGNFGHGHLDNNALHMKEYFLYRGNMETKAAVTSLSALAHEPRLGVFRLLVKAGPNGMAAGEIANQLGVLPNTLSASLNVLSHAGLIQSRRQGRSIIYSADYAAMSGLLAFLIEDCCAGNPDICAPLAAIASQCCLESACAS